MSALESRVLKRIEKYFFQYEKIRQAIHEAHANALYGTPNRDTTGGGGHAFVSDPTAQRGCALADPIGRVEIDGETIRRPETWVKIVDTTRGRYHGTQMGEFMARRYFRGEDVVKTCLDMGIDRSTYYNWREDIVTYAAMASCQAGTLKVYE